ncbi:hypothetical protein IFR04_012936 [Cadophora malorum]|uniref:Tat pathway signal sequence n=1 Tax=Cadophora malorum TaxID=108018 RepID=A0A8H7W111_9HELO|nr:hypothetical protein IFR04_012936 [Cadophora malorum]
MPSLLSKSGIFSKIPAVSKPKYEACENSDTESNRMSDETLLWNPEQFKSKGISFATKIAITANVLLFVFSGTTLLHAYQRDEKAHMNADLRKISAYSPLLDAMEFPMTRKMSFAQYGDGGPTIWRAPPSPEVDEAWDRMVIEDLWPVSQSEIKKMWKDHTVIAKLPAEYGDDAYVAKAAVFHNIHCLNSLRKAIHKDYYFPDGDPDALYQLHTSHCIQVLLENLMCRPNPAVYMYRWMEEFPVPVPDTNIWNQCWDFESVMEQYEMLALSNVTEFDIVKPLNGPFAPSPEFVVETLEKANETLG